jgi:hypothetical protein
MTAENAFKIKNSIKHPKVDKMACRQKALTPKNRSKLSLVTDKGNIKGTVL